MEELKQAIISKADVMAKALKQGKDVEIRKYKDGISVLEVEKHTIKQGTNGWDEISK